jgi:hypothetical protein
MHANDFFPSPQPSPGRKSGLPDLRKYKCATGVNPGCVGEGATSDAGST